MLTCHCLGLLFFIIFFCLGFLKLVCLTPKVLSWADNAYKCQSWKFLRDFAEQRDQLLSLKYNCLRFYLMHFHFLPKSNSHTVKFTIIQSYFCIMRHTGTWSFIFVSKFWDSKRGILCLSKLIHFVLNCIHVENTYHKFSSWDKIHFLFALSIGTPLGHF